MGGFIAFVQAVPQLIQLSVKFMGVAVRFAEWAEKNELEKWVNNLEGAIDDLEKADTSEKKFSSARALAGVIRAL